MSIKIKIFLIVFVLLTVLGGVDLAIQRFIVFPSFMELENHEAKENLRRIFHAIDRDMVHLGRFCRDWAYWDDSYHFVRKPSKKYIESNLGDEVMIANSLSLLAYCNTNGTIVWSHGFDRISEKNLAFNVLTGRQLAADHPLRALRLQEDGFRTCRGVFKTEHGPLLFATREILRSDKTGPAAGYLIMGRLLDQELVSELREQTRLPFEIVAPFMNAAELGEIEDLSENHAGNRPFFTQLTGDHITVCASYLDMSGQALFGIQYAFPRAITQKGMTSVRYAGFVFTAAALLLLGLISVLLQLVVVRPLRRLTEHAARLEREENFSLRLNLDRRDEIGLLAASFDTLVQTISDRKNELKQANEQLTQLSMIDGLTGIANRRMFDTVLRQEWQRALRAREPLSLVLADVDHFKKYNDAFGHQRGDQCLVAVAQCMQRQERRQTDLVARYGGEEFVVILPNTDSSGAMVVAESIRQAVHDLGLEHGAAGAGPRVSLSLGVATMIPRVEHGDQGFEQLLEFADQALYLAKNEGRNQARSHEDVPPATCILEPPEN